MDIIERYEQVKKNIKKMEKENPELKKEYNRLKREAKKEIEGENGNN